MQRQEDTRSLGELFSELANETTMLVRQEIQLARTEMTQKATRAGKDVGMIGAGGALAYAGLLALIAALIIGLGELIPLWLSALIVGLVVVGVGYMLIQRGLTALKQIDPVPQQTIQTLQEDKEWVKEQP
ncbi:MAG: phage holin family protein [Chloroflexi bacterium]|nr:phage holin family protein [Chloroflexota bacterium]